MVSNLALQYALFSYLLYPLFSKDDTAGPVEHCFLSLHMLGFGHLSLVEAHCFPNSLPEQSGPRRYVCLRNVPSQSHH